ncbi:type 1 glutamine amidotransferase [Texcoconibacillus texcoconensis]|uniref:GMP synthase-like glutamine amidotransferase n=1 Tax=Texcoconibacillus texcoconensis TaxID=1095777 RepID=A0A840QQY7_9BACI|nr:type 1 glutamine amidotransferase [Texcoconibacillus texcoconensis]MBB5173862.1 GMP synthase-like glutamine amidotransferase [Texcoconibacillus texcoconensis]
MKIAVIQHDPIVGPGVLSDWAQDYNEEIQLYRLDLGEALPSTHDFDMLISLGGRMGAYEEDKYPWLRAEKTLITRATHANKWILGICLGSQLIADALGGKAYQHHEPELGWHPVQFSEHASNHPLLQQTPTTLHAFEYHNDTFDLPNNAQLIAETTCAKQAFTIGEQILAVQFHPEFNEQMITYFTENHYPRDKKGPFIQPQQDVLKEANFQGSRAFMYQIMNNFKQAFKNTTTPKTSI